MKRYVITIVSAVVLGLAVTLVAAGDKARELKLQQAIDLIESKGDLAGATPLLEDVAKSEDRALAARGLLHLAQAQERFGKDAVATYQRIVSEFGESPARAVVETVALARARAQALAQRSGDLLTRRIWTQTGASYYATSSAISQDGRYLAFTDWNTGDLAVHNLNSGRDERLTSNALATRGYAEEKVFSPDGQWIAYGWENDRGDAYQVRVLNRTGGDPRVVYPNIENAGMVTPWAWSRDGKEILTHVANFGSRSGGERKDTLDLIWVPVSGGSPRLVKRFERTAEAFDFALSPDGRTVAYSRRSIAGRQENDLYSLSLADGSETVLSRHPANDRVMAWYPDGSKLAFASDREGSWGLWAINVTNGRGDGEPRLIRRETGLVSTLGFTRSGDFFYSRGDIQSEVYLASLEPSGQTAGLRRLESRFDGHKAHATWSPEGERLAYVQTANAQAAGVPSSQTLVVQNVATGESRQLSVALRLANNPAWLPNGQALLLQGTDFSNHSGLFQVDATTGALKSVIVRAPDSKEPAPVRPVLTANGSQVFFQANGVGVRDLEAGAERLVFKEPVSNFALSPDGRLVAITRRGRGPDLEVLLAPTSGGASRTLFTFAAGWTGSFPLAWSADGDSVLVAKQGANGPEVWRVPVDGKPPVDTGIRWSGIIARISAHPDGRRLALSTSRMSSEVWVLQNLPALRGQ
jgi:Tol biopolymer transport system component